MLYLLRFDQLLRKQGHADSHQQENEQYIFKIPHKDIYALSTDPAI
jgi:hypothetical protein